MVGPVTKKNVGGKCKGVGCPNSLSWYLFFKHEPELQHLWFFLSFLSLHHQGTGQQRCTTKWCLAAPDIPQGFVPQQQSHQQRRIKQRRPWNLKCNPGAESWKGDQKKHPERLVKNGQTSICYAKVTVLAPPNIQMSLTLNHLPVVGQENSVLDQLGASTRPLPLRWFEKIHWTSTMVRKGTVMYSHWGWNNYCWRKKSWTTWYAQNTPCSQGFKYNKWCWFCFINSMSSWPSMCAEHTGFWKMKSTFHISGWLICNSVGMVKVYWRYVSDLQREGPLHIRKTAVADSETTIV